MLGDPYECVLVKVIDIELLLPKRIGAIQDVERGLRAFVGTAFGDVPILPLEEEEE